jgi:nitrite reductase/ring-hydroxylating ferredoxin subunit
VSPVAPPAPLRGPRALRFDAQAELDPVAYVAGLARSVVALGGRIFEQSPVVATSDDEVRVAEGRSIRAGAVVHATHTPIGVAPALQLRLVPYTSYVVTARLAAPLEAALYWDCEDPYHYVRSTTPDRRLVLIGGEDHHVGRCADPAARAQALEAWARASFGRLDVVGRWSAELFETPDGLPFVGVSPGSRQLVAAGFAGTGITFGTVAAALLADLVLGRENAAERVFSPARLGPSASWPRLAREGLSASWRFVADRVRAALPHRARDVAPDSGVVTSRRGQPIALYRDPSGELHRLSARCTHMGCVVQWNDLEKTWDCPCHGGRYHRTGKVLYGPPTRDLERADEA